jgi:NDP-sugar pyrophosphorylase family protein
MEVPLSPLENNIKHKIICILLCAGEGTRISNHIGKIPKPLIRLTYIQNKPILYDTINKLLKFDIEKVIIITGYLKQNIEEYIKNLTTQSKQLSDKIILYDSDFEYQKGPLYSFLSITRSLYYFKEDITYILLPGDTIFDLEILYEILNQQYRVIDKYKSCCLIPFRKIRVSILKQIYKKSIDNSKVLITIAKIRTKNGQKYLKKIIQKNLSTLSKRKNMFQIIPCFMFNFNFMKKIITHSTKLKINTIREAINLVSKNGSEIYLHELNQNLHFFDIDTYQDLENLNSIKKKVDNSSSDNLRIHGSKT